MIPLADSRIQTSNKSLTSRSLQLLLRKKEKKAEYWPRLTKEKVRNAFLKTDFSKWVDEDEQDGDKAALDEDFDMGGMGGMGMPGMGGMGMPGMGGMGGMGDLDSVSPKHARRPFRNRGAVLMKMLSNSQMLKSMGGGAGGFDPDAAGPSGSADVEEDDSDDDGPPPLEEAEPKA